MAVGLVQQLAAYCGMMTLMTMICDDDDDDDDDDDGNIEHNWQRKCVRIS